MTIARLNGSTLKVVLGVAALAVLLRLVLGPGALGYDAAYALAWGDELRGLDAPDHDAELSPTPHPLGTLLGLAASVFGGSGPAAMLGLSYVAFAGVGAAAFLAGRRTFGAVAGVAFAAILLTRPRLIEQALSASIDIPFLALVLGALAAARRPRVAMVLLVLAGLLRPEAWLLAIAYAAWQRREYVLAAAAPVLWLAWDLLLTGDPLFSLTSTQDLAGTLERERGLPAAVDVLPASLEALLRPGVLWAGLVTGVVALVVAQRRAEVPLVVLILGLAGFLALGVFDLPLLIRYLLVPGAMLALFCAAGLAAFAWLPDRRLGAAASVAVALALVPGLASTADTVENRRGAIAFSREVDDSLLAVADAAPRGCRPVQSATHRAVPVLAYRLGVRPSEVAVLPPPRERGLLFAAPAAIVNTDIGVEPEEPAADVVLPPGFAPVGRGRWWTLGARC